MVELSPEYQWITAEWSECHPEPRIYSPDQTFRSVDAILASDAVHDAGNPVKSRFFLLSDVAVSFKIDDVTFPAYYSVYEDVASNVANKGYCTFSDVLVCPWTKGNLVAQMVEEWVHAITLGCDGYAGTFSN